MANISVLLCTFDPVTAVILAGALSKFTFRLLPFAAVSAGGRLRSEIWDQYRVAHLA